MMTARVKRKFARGIKQKPLTLIKKLRKAKKVCPEHEKPEAVRTHLRNMIIVPEMIGSVVGVYNGKGFTNVEVKPEMIGHYLGEFSITYKPCRHGKAGTGGVRCPTCRLPPHFPPLTRFPSPSSSSSFTHTTHSRQCCSLSSPSPF